MKISIEEAKAIYQVSPDSLKVKLSEMFGNELFNDSSKKVIKDWKYIKTFEDACEVTGDNPLETKFTEGEPNIIAYQKLIIIYKAINNGIKPDYTDKYKKRWYPWFTVAASGGVGFSNTVYNYTHTDSDVGFFLCTYIEEQAEYIGKTFTSLYSDYLIMK